MSCAGDEPAESTVEVAVSKSTHDERLGVLFVHGIGSQTQGGMLTEWVDAFVNWAGEWCEPSGIDLQEDEIVPSDDVAHEDAPKCDVSLVPLGAAVTSARLKPGGDKVATVSVNVGSDRQWLMAEAWWAESFTTPTYQQLVGWSFRVFPTALVSHGVTRARTRIDAESPAAFGMRARASIRWAGWTFLATPILFLMIPLVTAFIALLLIAGLLPIAWLRNLLGRVQLGLVAHLGDSQVLLDSPVQAAAMRQAVIDGVNHLRDAGCDRVAIIAHSQGAAIASGALRTDPPECDIDLFVSVGSGITKLEQLRGLREAGDHMWYLGISLASFVFTGALLWDGFVDGRLSWTELGIAAIGYFGLLAAFSVVTTGAAKVLDRKRSSLKAIVFLVVALMLGGIYLLDQITAALGPILGLSIAFVFAFAFIMSSPSGDLDEDAVTFYTKKWIDIWSRHDPVPNGATRSAVDDWPRSVEVRNIDSFLGDHQAYAAARDDALAEIAFALLELDRIPVGPDARQRLREARDHRIWRLLWLRFSRLLVAISVVVLIVGAWSDLGDATSWTVERFDQIGTDRDQVVSASTPADPAVDSSADVGDDDPGELNTLIAIAAIGILAWLFVLFYRAVWEVWNRSAERSFLRGEQVEKLSYFLAFYISGCFVPLVYAAAGPSWLKNSDRDWTELAGTPLAVGLSAMGYGVIVFGAMWLWFRFARQPNPAGDDRSIEQSPESELTIPD